MSGSRVEENMGLVHRVARDFEGRGVDLDDLIQEGCLGLMRADADFDEARKLCFTTYATHWIKCKVRLGVAAGSRPIRLPAWAWDALADIRATRRRLVADAGGVEPDDAAVMEAMGCTTAKRRETLGDVFRADRAHVGGWPVEWLDLLPDEADDEGDEDDDEDAATTRARLASLAEGLEALDPESRRVLTLLYGLDGEEPRGLKPTARAVGRSAYITRKIELAALTSLRARMAGAGVRDEGRDVG